MRTASALSASSAAQRPSAPVITIATASSSGSPLRSKNSVFTVTQSASLDRASDDVSHVRARLIALSPAATLRRGYAIVQRGDSSVVRSAAEVAPDEELTVRFADDQLAVTAGRPPGPDGPGRAALG